MPDADLTKPPMPLDTARAMGCGRTLHGDLPVAVPVGDGNRDRLIEKLVPRIEKLKVRALYFRQGRRLRPWSPRLPRQNINGLGANWLLIRCHAGRRRRDFKLQGYEAGFFFLVARTSLTMSPPTWTSTSTRFRASSVHRTCKDYEEGLGPRDGSRDGQRPPRSLPATAMRPVILPPGVKSGI